MMRLIEEVGRVMIWGATSLSILCLAFKDVSYTLLHVVTVSWVWMRYNSAGMG